MLDAFLETVAEHEKLASAEARNLELLDQLPDAELNKIANGGELKQAFYDGDGGWLDKFKESPLLQEAVALEKEQLQMQMEDAERRRESSEMYRDSDAKRDELCIRRKLLELKLVESEAAGEEAGDQAEEVVEEAGGSEEQAEEAEEEAEETGEEAAVDLGKAAMAMRFALAKEAVSRQWISRHIAAGAAGASPARLAKAHKNIGDIGQRSVNKVLRRISSGSGGARRAARSGVKSTQARKELVSAGGSRLQEGLNLSTAPTSVANKAAPSAVTRVVDPKSSKTMRSAGGAASKRGTSRITPLEAGAGATGLGVVGGSAAAASKDKAASISPEREQQVKEAFGAALMAGLKGMKNFAGAAGKSIGAAGKSGGLPAAGQAAMNAGRSGAMRAGKFIGKNPAAGAALVAAPAAAAGYAAG